MTLIAKIRQEGAWIFSPGILFVLLMAMSGQVTEASGNADLQAKSLVFGSTPPDINVPTQLWDLIEGRSVVDHGKILENKEYKDLGTEETLFFGAKVILREKTEGVLGGQPIEIAGSKLGLVLNFADVLKKDVGTLYFLARPDFEVDAKKMRVYFVSRAKKRRIDNQIWGSGCNTFSDITDYYFKQIVEKGMSVNLTRFRHASLLGGYILFVQKEDSGLTRISYIRLFDSRATYLECE